MANSKGGHYEVGDRERIHEQRREERRQIKGRERDEVNALVKAGVASRIQPRRWY